MKKMKRILSSILAGVMLLPMLVIPAFSEEADSTLYSNDFEVYAPKEGEFLAQKDGFAATTPSLLTAQREGENTFLKLPMASANDPNKIVYYTHANGKYTLVEESTEGAYRTDEASYGLISGSDGNLDKSIQVKQPLLDHEQTPIVILQVDYYLSEDANGTIQSQFTKYTSGGGEEKRWCNLFVIDVESGVVSLGNHAYTGVCLEKGAWSTFSMVVNLKKGTASVYVNRELVGNVSLGATNLTFPKNAWSVAKISRTNNHSHVAATELAGWVGVDNVCIFTSGEDYNVSVSEWNGDGEALLYTEILKDGVLVNKSLGSISFLASEGYSYRPVYFDSAAYEGIIPSVTEAELRLTDEGGIRFVNELELSKFEAFRELERAGEISDLRFGTLISPTVYVENVGALRVHKLEALRGITPYVKVEATYGEWYGADTAEDGKGRFAGSLLKINPSHYTDAFSAVGYVSFKLANGREQYLYGSYGSGTSVYALANEALQTPDGYSEAELAYMKGLEATEFTLGGTVISDVSIVSNHLFFRKGDVYACLTYTGNYGWRLRAQSGERIGFGNVGAAQALATYMNEEAPNDVLPIFASLTESGTLRITTTEGTWAELSGKGTFALSLYSSANQKVVHVENMKLNGGKVELYGRLEKDEGVFGGGERFDTVNCVGKKMTLYAADRWNNSLGSYMAIPLFSTSRGGGMYVNRYESVTADFSARNTWMLSVRNDVMDCYLFSSGKIEDVIKGYTLLTGNADTPAEWAYGVMICRYSKDLQTFDKDQLDPVTGEPVLNKDNAPSGRSVKTLVNALIEAGMKPTAMVMEAWGHTKISLDTEDALARRAELQATIDWLDSLGIKTMLYIRVGGSFSTADMAGYKEEYMLHAYLTVDGVTSYTTGIPAVSGDGANPDAPGDRQARYLDVTNPEACAWYYDQIWGQLIDMGIDGVKIDFCEELPDEDYNYGGTTIRYDWYDPTVIPQGGEHHSYPVYFISTFYKRMNELKAANGDDDGFYVLSRGGGIGSQRNPYMWAGDQARAFDKLDDQLMAVVTSGISGVPFMTYDMAGYRYNGGGTSYDNPNSLAYESEMFARAIAFTAFMPNIQTHGTVRNVYELTEDTQQIYRNFLALRELLIPYITTLTQYAAQTGIPVARHPILHFQNDARVCWINDQFMLGDGLMIAPILSKGEETRTVYLPEGKWTNLLTGETVTGGKEISVTANLGQVPVFLNNSSADAAMLREIFASSEWQAIRNWE